MARRRLFLAALVGVLFLVLLPGSVLADDPLDVDLNPVTGLIEAVAVSASDGDRLLHVEDPGQGGTVVDTVVSVHPAADSHIAIKSTGESWVVWQDETTSQIRYAYRDSASRTWTTEQVLSRPGEIAGKPTIVHSGEETWVAYEIGHGVGRSIALTQIGDSPEPWPVQIILATTVTGGSLDLTLHSEAGQVWLTWHDLPGAVTWSKLDRITAAWSAARIELMGVSTITRTLANIRIKALAP